MVCFCWTMANSSNRTEEVEENNMFESAFTYSTNFNYTNNYTNWGKVYFSHHYILITKQFLGKSNYYTKTAADEEARVDEIKPNSVVEIFLIGLSFIVLICTFPLSLIFSLKVGH